VRAAAKRRGVKLGGLNAKGIAERQAARERAEQLRPLFAELAGMSARKAAEELNRRSVAAPAGRRLAVFEPEYLSCASGGTC